MSKTWIVVCDRVSARVFSKKPFRLLLKMDNELGRERNRAMSTDKPGMSRAKFGRSSSVYALTGEKDPHEDAAKAFARKIAGYLDDQKNSKKFDELIIVAEPRMMGRIKTPMTKSLKEGAMFIAKDLGRAKPHQLEKALGLKDGEKFSG